VVSWSNTQVVATVASTAVTGIARIQQNGVWSNALAFTVPAENGVTLMPSVLNLMVGDTHAIQALSAAGQPVTGLTWTSSDPTVVSLSTDDPPLLTALAAGHVTITGGTASADVTVSSPTDFPGGLPLGTVLWSHPGDVNSITPAVPSPSGVADVFAFMNDGTVQAITSDGTTAWTANVGQGTYAIPDFQGGLVARTEDDSLVKFDGMNGQPLTLYTPGSPDASLSGFAVHTDATVFALQDDISQGSSQYTVLGIDSATGAQKFSVSVPQCLGAGPIMIAGDGYAYVPYTSVEWGSVGTTMTSHLHVLRISSSGASGDIPVYDWTYAYWDGVPEGFNDIAMITNADTGIVLTFWNPGHYHMAITNGTGASVVDTQSPIWPVLQAQDGSFFGTTYDGMVGFDATGGVRWTVPNEMPVMATADGGVIGQSGIIYDQSGGATGQMANMPTYSWLQNAYQYGSVIQVVAMALDLATGWAPAAFANLSGNGTAVEQPYLAPLRSCPGASTPCPQEAIASAVTALRALLRSPCNASCDTRVFQPLSSNFPEDTRTGFAQYLSLTPRLWDGTRSTIHANEALCPSGFWNQRFCIVGSEKMSDYIKGKDAVSQTPSDKGKGMQVFFDPAQGICNVWPSPNPGTGDQGVLNQATLFHEALHGYTGKLDMTLESVFGLPVTFGESISITYHLEDYAIRGGAFGARACGN